MGNGGGIVHDDGDDVEADFVPVDSGAGSEGAGGAHDVAFFFVVDVAVGGGVGVGGAGFYFHEDHPFAEAGDDVDFGVLAWLVVASDYLEAGALEVAVGKIFAQFS